MNTYEFLFFIDGSSCPFPKKIQAESMEDAQVQYDEWKAQQTSKITEKEHLPPKLFVSNHQKY